MFVNGFLKLFLRLAQLSKRLFKGFHRCSNVFILFMRIPIFHWSCYHGFRFFFRVPALFRGFLSCFKAFLKVPVLCKRFFRVPILD